MLVVQHAERAQILLQRHTRVPARRTPTIRRLRSFAHTTGGHLDRVRHLSDWSRAIAGGLHPMEHLGVGRGDACLPPSARRPARHPACRDRPGDRRPGAATARPRRRPSCSARRRAAPSQHLGRRHHLGVSRRCPAAHRLADPVGQHLQHLGSRVDHAAAGRLTDGHGHALPPPGRSRDRPNAARGAGQHRPPPPVPPWSRTSRRTRWSRPASAATRAIIAGSK